MPSTKKSNTTLIGVLIIFSIFELLISTSWNNTLNFLAPASVASCRHGVGDKPSVAGGYSFMKKKSYDKVVGSWRFIKNTPDLSPASHLKKIKGYTHYRADLMGQVISLVPKRNKILKPDITSRAYKIVDLCEKSIRKKHLVHRLIAKAWIPNVYGKPFINHKDVNPSNCAAYNIHWCTQAENQQYAFTHGNRKRGADMKNAKPVVRLTISGELMSKHGSIAEAAKETGVNRATVQTSCYNKYPKAWRHNFMLLEDYEKLKNNG